MPATGAIARTATNIRNGAFSPISGVVHALVLLLIMLVLGKYAEMIPMAALAAILFQVAFNMSGYKSFIKLFKAPKGDVSVLVVTFSLTILLDLTVAIQVGLLMAAVFFIHRMSEVSQVDFVSGILKDDENNEDSDDFYNLSSRSIPKGVEVFEISGSLFFGAVDKFKETLEQQSKQPRVLILRMRQVQSIDASGLQMIEDLLERLRGFGTQLLLSGVEAQPIVALNRSGLMHELGEKNVLANIDAALNRAREILGESLLEYSEKQSSQSVSWEVNLEKPWLPDQANALIAKETTEVITEKVLEDIEEKEHQNKKETNPENLD
jgi:SulP family sulfate permease